MKKILLFPIMILFVFLTACSFSMSNQHIDEKNIENNTEEMMKCIVNEDTEGLFEYFNNDMRDNYNNQTLKDIQTLFEYIDGKIISYEYKDKGGGEEDKHDGKIYYCTCYPKYEFTTDSKKTYTIEFSYHYIWDEHPEYEGVNMIFIREDNNYDTELSIGRNYYK